MIRPPAPRPRPALRRLLAALALGLAAAGAGAGGGLADPAAEGPAHAISMYGTPALPPDFVSLPQVNPDAPAGGRIVFGELGGFDSLNPYILRGRAPWGVAAFTVETLMGRAWDEPFTLYGLLAESVQTDAARSWVEFTLRPEARFADGSPVTVEDVIWSHDILASSGSPRYRAASAAVASVRQTGPRSVRFDLVAPDREMPLLLGLRPVLQKAQWEGRDFAASGLVAPVGSGPYVVAAHEPGRYIRFRRNPDWWGRDLAFNRGQHNIDELWFEYFADAGAMFEAFKAGEITTFRETSASRWLTGYDFPALRRGEVVKSEIPHRRPSGMIGLALNTRRAPLDDWRVREALLHSFNFEFVNATVNAGLEPRIASHFSNSDLGMRPGPATGAVRDLLAPFAADLPPGALEGYALPVSDGSEANRAGLRRAVALLAEAGWTPVDGRMRNDQGTALALEVLLPQGAADLRAAVTIWAAALERIGIELRITTVDSAQYTLRTNDYAFDITPMTRAMSLSPGTEQRLYWGREGVTLPGTRNWPGVDSPAVEAMIDAMLTAETTEAFQAAVRALDRALMAGRYVIPLWFADRGRIAHDARLRYPADRLPAYGDWQGFQPEVWWWQE
jgi:peptide/nickel transport system substrate-binding protein